MHDARPSALFVVLSVGVVLALLAASPFLPVVGTNPSPGSVPIKHIVVIVEENHTFDNYFGTYPGANGLNGSVKVSVQGNGQAPYVSPFHLSGDTTAHDLCHDWDCAHKAYDNGKMDGFIAAQGGSNLTMGYYDFNQIPYYWDYASQYVLLDNFYTSVLSYSLPNHLYLIAGQSGGLTIDARGGMIDFRSSLVYNSTFYFEPIVDELSAKNISWKYYAGGYSYLNNWNPLPAFAEFRAHPSLMDNLAPPSSFATDVKGNRLADVVWLMPPSDEESEHAPYNLSLGYHNVVSEINTIMQSDYWDSTAIFLTFDDWGGWYDHVPPPQVDGMGYGFRVPCLVLSPYARQGLIDHTQGDLTSILKFIETVYSLHPLTSRDSAAGNMMEAFNFSQSPRPRLVLPGVYMPNHYPLVQVSGETSQLFITTSGSSGTGAVGSTGTGSGGTSGDVYLLPSVLIVIFVVGSMVLVAQRLRGRAVVPPAS